MSDAPGQPAFRAVPLAPGLYLVATPIGTARDITLRALDILASADVLAAEDTRTARRLMDLHGIPLAGRPLLAYHDHNGPAQRPRLLAALRAGQSLAYVSEAGTPLVADPGYQLARAAIAEQIPLHAAPGPSAVLAALAVAGLPTDRFLFAGFPPPAAGARRRWMEEVGAVPATLVLFESGKRVNRLLGELCEALGEERGAALCRELTKRFEEVRRGSLATLREGVAADPPKGELVLVIERPAPAVADEEAVEAALADALAERPVREAAAEVAARFGLKRRDVYQRALRIREEGEG